MSVGPGKRILRLLVESLCRVAGYDVRNFTRAGYEEAIAGSELGAATQVGARCYSVHLAIQESERNRLSELLHAFAASHELRFFDYRQGSKIFSSRRMALFSPRGLHVHADMITGNSPNTRNMPRSPVILVGATFANHDDWSAVLRELDATLRAQWPDKTGPEELTRVEPINVPDLESWKQLSKQERSALQADYPYREEARPLIQAVVDDFRKEYGHIEDLQINEGPGIHHGGTWVIDVMHPLIFDRRKLPLEHLGVWVHAGISPDAIPPEYVETKQLNGHPITQILYEKFVDENLEEVRRRLKQPDMSREEMIAALRRT